MGVIVPIVLFLGLVTLVLGAPRFDVFRDRHRAGATARELLERPEFTAVPGFGLDQLPFGGTPFHYGSDHRLAHQVSGPLDGLIVTSATYTCRFKGATRLYGVVLLSLPRPLAGAEMRCEPAFHCVRVPEPLPEGRVRLGVEAFDSCYQAFAAPDPVHVSQVSRMLSPDAARILLAAPESFNWRVREKDLLLWRSGGWASSEQVQGGSCLDEDGAVVEHLVAAADRVRDVPLAEVQPQLSGVLGAGDGPQGLQHGGVHGEDDVGRAKGGLVETRQGRLGVHVGHAVAQAQYKPDGLIGRPPIRSGRARVCWRGVRRTRRR